MIQVNCWNWVNTFHRSIRDRINAFKSDSNRTSSFVEWKTYFISLTPDSTRNATCPLSRGDTLPTSSMSQVDKTLDTHTFLCRWFCFARITFSNWYWLYIPSSKPTKRVCTSIVHSFHVNNGLKTILCLCTRRNATCTSTSSATTMYTRIEMSSRNRKSIPYLRFMALDVVEMRFERERFVCFSHFPNADVVKNPVICSNWIGYTSASIRFLWLFYDAVTFFPRLATNCGSPCHHRSDRGKKSPCTCLRQYIGWRNRFSFRCWCYTKSINNFSSAFFISQHSTPLIWNI